MSSTNDFGNGKLSAKIPHYCNKAEEPGLKKYTHRQKVAQVSNTILKVNYGRKYLVVFKSSKHN